MNTLKAEKRNMAIKAKKLRREGYVTGNVFGKEIQGSIPIKMDKQELDRILKTCNKGSQLILNVDGQSMNVLIKEIDYNAMKRQVDEIDFQALVSGEKVHSVAGVIPLNHDKVAEGVLQLLLEEIQYRALPSDLVDIVEIDVGDMHVGDSIRVGDLAIAKDENIELLTDPDAIVVTVSEVRNKLDTDAEAAGETAENPAE